MAGFNPVGSAPVDTTGIYSTPINSFALASGRLIFGGVPSITFGNTGGGEKVYQMDVLVVTGAQSGVSATQLDTMVVTGPLAIAVSQMDGANIVVGPIGIAAAQMEMNIVINTKWKAQGQMLLCTL